MNDPFFQATLLVGRRTCIPPSNRFEATCDQLGTDWQEYGSTTSGGTERLDCYKVQTLPLSYADAKDNCTSYSFDLAGQQVNAMLLDLTLDMYSPIPSFYNHLKRMS